MANNDIRTSGGSGIKAGEYLSSDPGSMPTIQNNVITQNGTYPLFFEGSPVGTVSGNTLTGNGRDAYGLSGTFDVSGTLKNIQGLSWPYVTESSVYIEPGVTLSIPAGTVIKGGDADTIQVEGILDVQGTAGSPVVFTSYRDDSYGGDSNGDGPSVGQPGDWRQIEIRNGNNALEHCVIRYGGYDSTAVYYASLYLYQCSPTVRYCTIEYALSHGIGTRDMAGGTISYNTIRNCGSDAGRYGAFLDDSSPTMVGNVFFSCAGAVRVIDSTSHPVLNQCDFAGNSVGLDNTSGNLISAENSWWGSTTGPSGVGPGSGDSVSANVDYTPWLGMPNNRYYSGEASIVGHVYRDTNSNGQYDSGEGISGATVRTLNGFTAENTSTADGSFEITDIPGDAGYIVMAEALGYSAGVREGVWVNALNATAVDIPLRQIDISTLSVEQISPNPNDYDHNGTEDAMTLMKGGTGYRYYRVVNSQGEGVSACGYTVKRADGVVITNGVTLNYQGLPGVMQIGIPESLLSVSGSSGDVSCIVTHLNGVELPSYKKKSFLVQVRPREYDTAWQMRNKSSVSGEIIGGLKASYGSHFDVVLQERDGSLTRPDKIRIKRHEEAAGGVSAAVPGSTEGGIRVGGVGGYAGAVAKAHLLIGAQFHDEHDLNYVSADTAESMAKIYMLCYPGVASAATGAGTLASGGNLGAGLALRPFLMALDNLVGLNPYLTEVSGGAYIDGEGRVTCEAALGSENPFLKGSIGAGTSLKGNARFDMILGYRPVEDELVARLMSNLDVAWRMRFSVDGSTAIGSPGDVMTIGLNATPRAAWGLGVEEINDATALASKEIRISTQFVLAYGGAGQESGTTLKRTWIVRGNSWDLELLAASLPLLGALQAAEAAGLVEISIDNDTLHGELGALALAVERSNGRLWMEVQDQIINGVRTELPVFDFWGSIGGVGATINVGATFDNQKQFTAKRGLSSGTRYYPLDEYQDDAYTPDSTLTLGDLYADTWQEIDWAGLLAYVSETAAAGAATTISNAVVQGQQIGQALLTLPADTLAAGTEIANNAWAGFWSAIAPPQTMGASTSGTLGLREATAEDEGGTNNWRFGIGGFYELLPAGTVLSSPGTFVISYADSEVEGIPEDTLAMYLWNTNSLRWDYQGGTVDLAGNSVSNQITVLGLYTLAPRMPYDFAELTPVPSAIPNDGASTVVFTSGVISNDDNTVISDGQLFTVSASGGTITTPDADGTVTGLQVTATSGQISFTVQSSLAATSITVNASSVIGEAYADGQVVFLNAGAPAAPQNVAAVVDGTAIRVSWQAITNSDVVGYSVLYDDDNGAEPFEGKAGVIGDDSPIDVGNVSVYRLYGLETNVTYYVALKATDAFGLESTLSAVVSVLNTCPPDSDADGLPDTWENEFATPTVPSVVGISVAHFDSFQDNDTDGMNNWSEYIAGTDPTDASSLFGVADATVVQDPRGFAVEWDGVNGRTYQVYVTTNLVGSWTTFGGPLAGSNGTMRVTVPMTNAVPQFIKLNVQKD